MIRADKVSFLSTATNIDPPKELKGGHNYMMVTNKKNNKVIDIVDVTDMTQEEIEKWWEEYKPPTDK
jgi:hypothetical protein